MQVLSSELLERVYLGYNPLGPIALLQLPSLLSKSPNLRLFEAECCDLGNYIWVTLEMKEEFHASVSSKRERSKFSLGIYLIDPCLRSKRCLSQERHAEFTAQQLWTNDALSVEAIAGHAGP